MSAFGGLILTNKGRNLQAKAQAGAQLNFTRIAVGDGSLSGTSILDLTALKNEVKSLAITKLKTMTGGKAVVGTVFSNETILVGFYWRELGVFAQDPDLGEILYCYGNAGVNAEYIPSGGGPDIIEKSIDVVSIIGNATNVTATIESSLVYVSAQDFEDHIANIVAHVTQTDRDGWSAKETPTGAQTKATTAETNAKTYADTKDTAHLAASDPHTQYALDTDLAGHLADYMPHQSGLNSYASVVDANGIYTVLDLKRADGTLYMKSMLSGGILPNYTTDTWQFYDELGTTVMLTKTWTITYDANGKITSKVVA